MKFLLICLISMVLFVSSCSKSSVRQNTVKPLMELVYPTDQPVLKPGQPLCIKIIITDDEQIRSVDWSIRQDESNTSLFRNSLSANDTRHYVFDEKFIIPDQFTGDHMVLVKATDQCGNSSDIKLAFTVRN